MDYTSNTKEALARIAILRANLAAGTFSDALVAGLNAGMAVMKLRIFNQSLDATGVTLGPYYSESWERERRQKGRQVVRKDLEFTGTLRRSIEVVTVNNTRAEIRITNDDTADIARYQEQQIYALRNDTEPTEGVKVPIFEFSTDEAEIVRTTTNALLAQKFSVLDAI